MNMADDRWLELLDLDARGPPELWCQRLVRTIATRPTLTSARSWRPTRPTASMPAIS